MPFRRPSTARTIDRCRSASPRSARLGDALLAARPLARIGQGAPAPVIALVGATLIYLLAQLPGLGPIIGITALAFGLGSAAAARLGHAGSATA